MNMKFAREKASATMITFNHIITIRAEELPLICCIKFIDRLRLS